MMKNVRERAQNITELKNKTIHQKRSKIMTTSNFKRLIDDDV
jgi:hypothetical protein